MHKTKRRPVSVGEILKTEFLMPMGITQKELAESMEIRQNVVSQIIRGTSALTVPMAIKLADRFGNSPEFWLNIQHATDLWDLRNNHQNIEEEDKTHSFMGQAQLS